MKCSFLLPLLVIVSVSMCMGTFKSYGSKPAGKSAKSLPAPIKKALKTLEIAEFKTLKKDGVEYIIVEIEHGEVEIAMKFSADGKLLTMKLEDEDEDEEDEEDEEDDEEEEEEDDDDDDDE